MIYPKKSNLKVTPVKRYNRAKYPAFDDPNPLDHPDTLPYPFSEKVFKILCSMGFTGALLLSSPEDAEAITPEVISLTEQDSLENPFTEQMTGLPFRPASFGTGLPSRLGREESIDVINRVFREEGIVLDSMVNLEKDGVVVKADGFNKEKKIGYVYIGYNRIGEGTMINNYNYYKTRKFNDEYVTPKRNNNVEKYVDKNGYVYKYLKKEKTAYHLAFLKFIDEVYPTLPPAKQLYTLESQYLIFTIQGQLENISESYPDFSTAIQEYIAGTEQLSNIKLEKKLTTLGILRRVKGSFPNLTESVLVKDFIASHDQSEKEWSVYYNNIQVLLDYKRLANNENNDKLLKLIEQAFMESGEAQQRTFTAINCEVDLIKVDLSEVKNIASAADEKKYFLAPISHRDPRLTYHHGYMRVSPENIKRLIAQFETQLETETDDKLRAELEKEIERFNKMLNEKQVDPKERPLKLLEEQVRNYIHWAKSQSGY